MQQPTSEPTAGISGSRRRCRGLLLGGDDGLLHYDAGNDVAHRYWGIEFSETEPDWDSADGPAVDSGLPAVICARRDRTGTLWIGTEEGWQPMWPNPSARRSTIRGCEPGPTWWTVKCSPLNRTSGAICGLRLIGGSFGSTGATCTTKKAASGFPTGDGTRGLTDRRGAHGDTTAPPRSGSIMTKCSASGVTTISPYEPPPKILRLRSSGATASRAISGPCPGTVLSLRRRLPTAPCSCGINPMRKPSTTAAFPSSRGPAGRVDVALSPARRKPPRSTGQPSLVELRRQTLSATAHRTDAAARPLRKSGRAAAGQCLRRCPLCLRRRGRGLHGVEPVQRPDRPGAAGPPRR